jgi:hypothetical protein
LLRDRVEGVRAQLKNPQLKNFRPHLQPYAQRALAEFQAQHESYARLQVFAARGGVLTPELYFEILADDENPADLADLPMPAVRHEAETAPASEGSGAGSDSGSEAGRTEFDLREMATQTEPVARSGSPRTQQEAASGSVGTEVRS